MAEDTTLSDEEIRLRLIEAAAACPAVRIHTDFERASAAAHAMADVWYTNFIRPGADKTKIKFFDKLRPRKQPEG